MADYAALEKPCRMYREMEPKWVLIADLLGGTKTMREAGTRWLPTEPAESKAAYEHRLQLSCLFNGLKRAIQSLVGRPFSKPVMLRDMNPTLEKFWENIDLQGRHGDLVARDIATAQIADGISYILVDYPPVQAKTLADKRALNLRPYWVIVDARNIIGWRSEFRNGVEVATQVRIKECLYVPDGEWGEREVKRIRVLEPGSYKVYELDSEAQTDADKYKLVDEGTTSLTYIPLVPVYGKKTGFMQCEPPLLDLSYLNVRHWQSSSDQMHILHVARVPLLFGSGFSDDVVEGRRPLILGPNRAVFDASPSATLRYVEHTGAAINAGRDDIESIENQMAVMSVDLLAKKAQATATEGILGEIAEDSDLSAMMRSLEDAMEQAFAIMADYEKLGEDAVGDVVVNKDFGVSLRDVQDLQTLQAARTAGDITQETFLRELQRRGVLDNALNIEDEISNTKAEAPAAIPGKPGEGFNKPAPGAAQTEEEAAAMMEG